MLSSTKWALVIAGIGGTFVGILGSVSPPEAKLRFCGHSEKEPLLEQLGFYRATHCCVAGGAIGYLKSIHAAQEIWRKENGCFATTISALTNLTRLPESLDKAQLASDGTDWSLRIPKNESLPGHYLLRSDGCLYFNSSRPADTNDVLLQAFARY